MNQAKTTALIWPSLAALDQARQGELRRVPTGFAGELPWFTFESLFSRLREELPLPPGRELLLPLAGPWLVLGLVRELHEGGDPQAAALLRGAARGRRLPRRVWRLLVEIKAAGLEPPALLSHPSRRVQVLGRLFAAYQQALKARGLLDQADVLALLEDHLARGWRPEFMAEWQGITARGQLWLRAMDLRLLRALARLVPVRVEFALLQPRLGQAGVFRLLENTARVLEADPGEMVEVDWLDPVQDQGPLAPWALGLTLPGGGGPPADPGAVELVRAAGRYAEVEALLERVERLLAHGVPPEEMALVFPDLGLYGQMAGDVARRRGIPLDHVEILPLAQAPPVAALLAALELALGGYPREELAALWDSPYLGPWLARLALGGDPGRRVSAAELLRLVGYVDGRETPPGSWLEESAARHQGYKEDILELARCCDYFYTKLQKIEQQVDFQGLISELLDWLPGLEPDGKAPAVPPGLGRHQSQAAVRDLLALRELRHTLEDLAAALEQINQETSLGTAGRLALLRDILEGVGFGVGRRPLQGVRLLTPDQAQGLELDYLLIGGLSQGEFPRRPGGGTLLTGAERLELGRLAGIPVWRTDEEEYSGQLLRLVNLLASARRQVVLSCPAADAAGRELEPAFIYLEAARSLGRDLPRAEGGVFGRLPPLERAVDPLGLWAGLSATLTAGDDDSARRELAQAALWHLVSNRPGTAQRWQAIVQRARAEERRESLALVPLEELPAAADGYCGHLSSAAARELLRSLLAQPRRRRISASFLETYVACPAGWFWGRLLGLGPVPQPAWDLERRWEGEWVHRCLRLFFQPDEYRNDWDSKQIQQRLEECLDRAWRDLEQEGLAGHPVAWRAMKEPLLRGLLQVVERECQEMPPASPWAVEAGFGLDEDGPAGVPVELLDSPAEPPLTLVGRLDRLDVGDGLVRVSDYKHTGNDGVLRTLTKKEEQGESVFQLPVYLLAARHLLGDRAARAELRGRVVPTRLVAKNPKSLEYPPGHPFLADDPRTRRRLRDEGGLNLLNRIEELWQAISNGDFVPRPGKKQCERCDFVDLCRTPAAPEGGEGAPA